MTLDFGNFNPNLASIGKIKNDKLFLVKFILPFAGVVFKTKTPKLTMLAKRAKTVAKGQAFEFYTKDTCMEFHELLKELLKHFKATLEEVENF